MAEDTTGGGGGKWAEGECGQDPRTGDRRQRESRVLLATLLRVSQELIWFPRSSSELAFSAHPCAVVIYSMLPESLLPAGLFLPGNINPRLPGQPFWHVSMIEAAFSCCARPRYTKSPPVGYLL